MREFRIKQVLSPMSLTGYNPVCNAGQVRLTMRTGSADHIGVSAPLAGKFQDHYKVLGVEPKSDTETIHQAYSTLAQRFHPNNKSTGDEAKYKAVTQAYEVLMDPAARQAFDAVRGGPPAESAPRFSGGQFFQSLESDGRWRQCLLCILYDRRRKKPATPGLSVRHVENMMTATSEQVQFTIWYLKQRGYVASDDKSNLQITIQGIDHLEKSLPEPGTVLGLLKPDAVQQPEKPPDVAVVLDTQAQLLGMAQAVAKATDEAPAAGGCAVVVESAALLLR